ncbi:hypothetical protein BDV11DRAFT_175153 [Aspergillus similis]
MEPLSCAASVIAVVQLTGSIVRICGGYIQEVKDAREDIILLKHQAASLLEIVEKLAEIVNSQKGEQLSASWTLANDATSCKLVLTRLIERIDPENTRTRTKSMRKLGLRALKWPLKRAELERITQDLERYKSSFILALQVDQVSYSIENSQSSKQIEQKFNLEALPMAHGAEFDSYMNQHESECLRGTRTELCREIKEWAVSSNGKCIFWLNGLAGTGKSTISRTMAKSFQQDGLLGASFFFKRGEGDRGNATKLFPTIIRQLLTRHPELLPAVMTVIKDDPRISGKPLKEQFKKLLLRPLLSLESGSDHPLTLVIVIDALDECENDSDIRTILQLLPRVQELTSLHLRAFVASRPELPVRLGFRAVGNDHQNLILHEVPEHIIAHDISVFLEHKLVAIRQERSLPPDWPGDMNFQTLVTMSVPSFIFAATICRVFEDHNLDPMQCLRDILKYQNQESRLDGTYLPVLDRLVSKYHGTRQKQVVQEVQELIGIIILLKSPLSVASLSKLMGISTESVNARLNSLHSVLDIPIDKMLPVRLFHLSFRDFLLDPNSREKTPFWVDEREMNQKLTVYCLSVMHRLKKNICSFESYGTERRDIDSQTIDHYVPPELQYSCRYWTHHLTQSKDPINQIDNILLSLEEHFLHWVEVMSMLGSISEVVEDITALQSAVQSDKGAGIFEFLQDAKRFILKNSQVADIAPLQLYASGLIFAPKTAIIRRVFQRELPDWIDRGPEVEENWSSELQTLEGHSDWVLSVAFSPDGRLLASGSVDRNIKLWDPATGTLKHTLEGHSDWVQSVAFSSDGRLLASHSRDEIIKLWDPASGVLKHTLAGHSDWVQSVAFSPNGRLLASGSRAKTIKLWDPATGALKHTLEGHSDWVLSVAFSPDGRLLASGSVDRNIKLWDPASGALKHTLEGHSDWVRSVAFSPDGRLLASHSVDKTIKLWDPATGALKHTLAGHSDWVQSIAFQPDGRLLASGSRDKTIKLWDPATDALKHTLEGHSEWVSSVAFSPDGRLLASGSHDKTIKLWDPATGSLKQTLGTDGPVNIIEFSWTLPQLITNLGAFDIGAWHDSFPSNPSEIKAELSLQQSGRTRTFTPQSYGPGAAPNIKNLGPPLEHVHAESDPATYLNPMDARYFHMRQGGIHRLLKRL